MKVVKKARKLSGGVDGGSQSASLMAPERIFIGDTLDVEFETNSDHKDTDWIGVYDMDSISAPGRSGGKWSYVPLGATGVVQFPSSKLPAKPGVYELRYCPCFPPFSACSLTRVFVIRYHLDNKYV